MESNGQCCGKDIKICAKIVAIIGIVSSILSFNILGLVIYILVYVGVQKGRPEYLLPAKILLIIGVICTIILLIVGLVVGIIFATRESDLPIPSPSPDPDRETQKKFNPIFIVIYGILFLFGIVYLFISLIIIHRARNYLLLHPGMPEFSRSFSFDEK